MKPTDIALSALDTYARHRKLSRSAARAELLDLMSSATSVDTDSEPQLWRKRSRRHAVDISARVATRDGQPTITALTVRDYRPRRGGSKASPPREREAAKIRSIRITDAEWRAAEEAAEDAGMSTGELVRLALGAYLQGELAPQIQQLIDTRATALADERARALIDEQVGPAVLELAQRSAEANRCAVELARLLARATPTAPRE